jgi:hypothetical protein
MGHPQRERKWGADRGYRQRKHGPALQGRLGYVHQGRGGKPTEGGELCPRMRLATRYWRLAEVSKADQVHSPKME